LTTPLKNATKNQKYFLAQSIIKGRKNHAKEKRKKAGEETRQEKDALSAQAARLQAKGKCPVPGSNARIDAVLVDTRNAFRYKFLSHK